MTTSSNIVTTTIDAEYPVPGVDNDTKGFRDNFANIITALETAKTEITELQNYAVITAAVSSETHTTPVTNNLNNSTIINGTYNQFYGAVYETMDANQSGSLEIDVSLGELQRIKLTVDTGLTFKNWPSASTYSSRYALVRIHLILDQSADPDVVNILTIGTHGSPTSTSFYKEIDLPSFHVSKTTEIVFDAWSYNGGSTFFVKYIGEFQAGL